MIKMDCNLYYLDQYKENIDDSKVRYTLDWRIPDFMWLLNNQTNREICTKETISIPDTNEEDNTDQYKFKVKIQFVGHKNDLVEIYYKAHKSVYVKAYFKIWMDVEEEYILLFDKPDQVMPRNEWQYFAVLLKSDIFENYELSNGLEVRLEFLVSHDKNDIETAPLCLPVNGKEIAQIPNCSLINDLKSLLMNTTLSDLIIKSVEGDEFPAHKIFLTSRSAVFNAHFEHNTVESKTNVVEFPFETEVLKDVLSYIYTDNAPKIDKMSQKLLKAADFYQLNGLKKLCEIKLEETLTVENAIETLELANLYRLTYLKGKILEFIKGGLAEVITETEGWKVSQSAEVVKSVYECVVTNKLVWS